MTRGLIAMIVVALLLIGGLATCNGTRIKSGEVGVRVIEMGGNAGVQERELTTGWYIWQPGSYVLKFPTTVQTEVWSNQEGAGGRHINFNNADGVNTGIAVSMLLRIDPDRASDAVQRYRLGLDGLIDGPVRRRIQGAFIALGTGPAYTSEALTSGPGAAALLAEVRASVEGPLRETEGVIIEDLVLVGAPGLPSAIRNQINQRIEQEQAAQAAQAGVARVEAEGRQRVAEAEAEAQALDALGAALRRNPEVLRQREIEEWHGLCPLDSDTCVIGGSALDLVARLPQESRAQPRTQQRR